jgi:recombination protein RecT
MNQPVQKAAPSKGDLVAAFKNQVANGENEFRAALPAHIPVERFMRVVTTAVTSNPDLLGADRRSLFESATKAAQDGLLPDGRDGALVIFNTKIKEDGKESWIKKVQWMPMIAGILKKVRNSGELISISAYVAYSNDEFVYELGDDEKISHRPALEERGKPRLVYAIAKTKDGGIYREVMTVAEVEKVRAVSRAAKSGPWVDWWDEMARKTVMRRLAKRLPMSSDLDDLIRRDDALYDFDGAREKADEHIEAPARRTLASKLDALATSSPFAEQETPHDPETGEIVETPKAAADKPAPAAQEPDWRALLAELAAAFERAQTEDDLLAESDAAQQAWFNDAPKAIRTQAEDLFETHRKRICAPKPAKRDAPAPVETEAADVGAQELDQDPKLTTLLAAAREKTQEGAARFKFWVAKLAAPDFERIEPHLQALREQAADADAARE